MKDTKSSRGDHIKALEAVINTGILRNLQILNLSNSLLNGELLITLLPLIACNCPGLNDLDLSKNNIGVPGASVLGEAFPLLINSRNVFQLDLSENNLDSMAMTVFTEKVIAISKLKSVSISQSTKCDIHLSLNKNPLRYEDLLGIFRILQFDCCRISKLEIEDTVVNVLSIDFATSQLENTQKFMSKLQKLCMSKNTASSRLHLNALFSMLPTGIFTNLEELNLAQTLLSNCGELLSILLPSLSSHCPHLVDLDLSENHVGIDGACALGENFLLLTSNKKQFHLDLSECSIDNECMIAFSEQMAEKMFRSTEITLFTECHLCLDKNPLESTGLWEIMKVLSYESCPITRLDLRRTQRTTTNSGIDEMSNFNTVMSSRLTTLHLNDNRLNGDTHLKILTIVVKSGLLASLEKFDLSESVIARNDEASLTELISSLSTYCPKLTSLDFSNTNLNVPEACALGDNLTLLVYGKKQFHLDLSKTYFDTEASIAFCKKVIDKLLSSTDTSSTRELEYSSCALYLNRNPIGYNGFLALFKMLSTKLCPITNLQIKDTYNSTTEINSTDLEADSVMGSRLTTLCLGDNQFTGEIYARAFKVAVRVDVLEFRPFKCSHL